MTAKATQLRLAAGAYAPLTVAELAHVLGVAPAQLRAVVAALRPICIGRHPRYLLGDVIEALRAPAPEPTPTRRAGRPMRREAL